MTETLNQQLLTIRIDSNVTAKVLAGIQLQLFVPGRSAKRPIYASSLTDLNIALESKGVRRPYDLQTYSDTSELIHGRISPLAARQQASPKKPLTATFGRGGFKLSWNPLTPNGSGSVWPLTNPGRTIPRLDDKLTVGYFSNPFRAVWTAVERTLYARPETIAYDELNGRVLAIAEDLLADLKEVRV